MMREASAAALCPYPDVPRWHKVARGAEGRNQGAVLVGPELVGAARWFPESDSTLVLRGGHGARLAWATFRYAAYHSRPGQKLSEHNTGVPKGALCATTIR